MGTFTAPGRALNALAVVVAVGVVVLLSGCQGPTSQPSPTVAAPSPVLSQNPPASTPAPLPSLSGGPIRIPTSSASIPPQPKPTPSATAKAAKSVAAFLSPSKNIECGRVQAGGSGEPRIACQIFERSFKRPSCPSRQSQQAGTSVVVYLTTSRRPTAVACASDVAVPAQPRSSAYGNRFVFKGGTQCTVTPENVRCSNAAGHGFVLARSAFSTF